MFIQILEFKLNIWCSISAVLLNDTLWSLGKARTIFFRQQVGQHLTFRSTPTRILGNLKNANRSRFIKRRHVYYDAREGVTDQSLLAVSFNLCQLRIAVS